jgi:hypothetical protein
MNVWLFSAHRQQNKQLLELSRQILELTKEVRAQAGRDDAQDS